MACHLPAHELASTTTSPWRERRERREKREERRERRERREKRERERERNTFLFY